MRAISRMVVTWILLVACGCGVGPDGKERSARDVVDEVTVIDAEAKVGSGLDELSRYRDFVIEPDRLDGNLAEIVRVPAGFEESASPRGTYGGWASSRF